MAAGLVLVGCGTAPAAPAEPPRPADCPAPTSSDLTTADGWLGRIAMQPDTVGVLVDDGRGRVVAHRADRSFPLASAVKVVHLAAYAAAVSDGRVRPEDRVTRGDWERWYVPGTDGDAHPAALQRLGPGPDYTVDQLVTAMIRESDNAAADWLRARLGDDALRAAAASAGWQDVELPGFAGAAARLAVPELAPSGATHAQLVDLDGRLGRRVADDPAFRAEVVRRIGAAAAQDPTGFVAAARAWSATTAQGTPAQLLGVHRAIATGALPGAGLAARQLSWQGATPGVGTVGFKSGSFVDVLTFGGFLRRDDGSVGYAVVLGRDLPGSPPVARQVAGQQGLVLEALTSPRALDRLACVA
ncbi:serine hydrolase [Actinomycetospora sp. CA-084318]|uniref:serine hydrolase n=1 Tax=Actinomycetospora sp. CA-084318 TaxID=3239892 RepID=UPI003D96C730